MAYSSGTMTGKTLLILFGSCCAVSLATADDCPYAEYRLLEAARQIQITTGYMERTPATASKLAALEKTGIVVLETEVARTFTRKERVGAHRIETTISLAAPAGHGEGGAASNVGLKVIL